MGHGKVLRLQKVQSEGIGPDAARSANDANGGDWNLVCRTSRPSVAIEMTYISAHSWRVRTTPECPAKLRHQPGRLQSSGQPLISHNKCKPLFFSFLAILICGACLWCVSMATAVITAPCLGSNVELRGRKLMKLGWKGVCWSSAASGQKAGGVGTSSSLRWTHTCCLRTS